MGTWARSTGRGRQIKGARAAPFGLSQHAAREREVGADLGQEARCGPGAVFIGNRQGVINGSSKGGIWAVGIHAASVPCWHAGLLRQRRLIYWLFIQYFSHETAANP